MLWLLLTSQAYPTASRELDLDLPAVAGFGVVARFASRQEFECEHVRGDYLSNAADEMAVGSELAARKKRFEIFDDGVELGEQFADLRPSVTCLAGAPHCHVLNSG